MESENTSDFTLSNLNMRWKMPQEFVYYVHSGMKPLQSHLSIQPCFALVSIYSPDCTHLKGNRITRILRLNVFGLQMFECLSETDSC